MPSHHRIFAGELDYFGAIKVVKESRVNFSRELVYFEHIARCSLENAHLIKELIQELDVNEHCRGIGEFVGHDVEECLWTESVILSSSATPPRLQSRQPESKNAYSVCIKDCVASCRPILALRLGIDTKRHSPSRI